MKDFYYNIEDAEFIDQTGEKLSRFAPELFYQESAVWRIFLRDRKNRPCGLSGIVAWSAAVDCDYDSDTAPMCRVLPENISADTATGSVTVTLDAATAEFLAAVNGVAKRQAFFEMHGVDAAGDRKLYLGFEIVARMILDPAPTTPQQVAEIFATRYYVDMTLGNSVTAASAALQQQLDDLPTAAEARQIAEETTAAVISSGGYVNSSEASGIAASATSGAIFSGAEIDTTVGEYRLTYTGSGGLLVSGDGVQFQVSSGAIVASGANGESMALSGGTTNLHLEDSDGEHQDVTLDATGVSISAAGADRRVVIMHGGGEKIEVWDSGVFVNSRPVLTKLVTATDSETTSASFAVLGGGTAYIYTRPLTSLGIASITNDCRAEFDFTAGAGFDLTLPMFASRGGVSNFSSGGRYLVTVDGLRVSADEYRIDSQVGVWLMEGANVVSAAPVMTGAVVTSGQTLYVYSCGVANSTVVSGGIMYVSGGGTATGALIHSGGTANVYGALANASAVETGTYITVYSGGTASDTAMLFGQLLVSSGGFANSVFLSGTAPASRGILNLRDGGSANNVTAARGENVYANGSVTDLTINGNGAVAYLRPPCVASDVSVVSGTLIVSSGASALAVTSNAGTVVTVVSGGYIEYA